jgi:hypothetical protein
MTALVEMTMPPNANRILKFFYFNLCTISLCANIYCVSQTTCLAVAGTSLSLRGPDGSMITYAISHFNPRLSVWE